MYHFIIKANNLKQSDDLAKTVEVGDPHFNGSAALSLNLFWKLK